MIVARLGGSLPASLERPLPRRDEVFVGPVRFGETGNTVCGIWWRGATRRGIRRDGTFGTKGASQQRVAGARTTLVLLEQLEPEEVDEVTEDRVRAAINRHCPPVLKLVL